MTNSKYKNADAAYLAMVDDYNNLMSTIDAFNGKVNLPINSEQLNLFPTGIWKSINEKVKVRKRKNRFENYLNFDTDVKKDGGFGDHFHNDVIESFEVIWGVVKNLNTGVVYTAGDVVNYAKGEKHHPVALEDSMLHVLFKP